MSKNSNITRIIETLFSNISIETKTLYKEYKLSAEHPDLVIIKSENNSSIGVSEVKSLRNWSFSRPFSAEKKLVVIENADLLTIQAQNSLLKLIEEPPSFTHIFLIVENHKNLLPTIISRSQIITKTNLSNKKRIEGSEAYQFLAMNMQQKFKFIDKLFKAPKQKIRQFLNDVQTILYKEKKDAEKLESLILFNKALEYNVNKKVILDNLVLLFS
jgi:DNA polymerase III delta prime subunit